MSKKSIAEAMRFYLLATQLKYKIRSGWDETHWNVSKERVESIAEHVYGTCILALSIDSEFETNLDINKVVKMLVIHELGEVVIGDITPFDNITPEEKMEKEHEAIKEVLGDLIKKDEFYSLLLEFDDKKTKKHSTIQASFDKKTSYKCYFCKISSKCTSIFLITKLFPIPF